MALTGEGGDELFGGYYRHQAARLAAARRPAAAPRRGAPPAGARNRLGSEMAHPMSTRHKLYRFLRSVELEPGERYAEWTAVLTPAGAHARVSPALRARASRSIRPGASRNPLDRALAVDLARSLPDQLLYKMDIATMASSLEARAPLLDYRLVEWAARLPTAFKQRGTSRKRLISDALGAPRARGDVQTAEDGLHRADPGLAARRALRVHLRHAARTDRAVTGDSSTRWPTARLIARAQGRGRPHPRVVVTADARAVAPAVHRPHPGDERLVGIVALSTARFLPAAPGLRWVGLRTGACTIAPTSADLARWAQDRARGERKPDTPPKFGEGGRRISRSGLAPTHGRHGTPDASWTRPVDAVVHISSASTTRRAPRLARRPPDDPDVP